jgi:hypothetical protein
MKRFTLTVSQKSAEGKVGHAVGEDIEAAWLEPSDSWKKSVSWKTASRRQCQQMAYAAMNGRSSTKLFDECGPRGSSTSFSKVFWEAIARKCARMRVDGVSRAVEERLFRAA